MLLEELRKRYPKFYLTETRDDKLKFRPENDTGSIEYKRTLENCSDIKAKKYATQMRWRILQNRKKQCATYYIGVDDDGTITGLTDSDAMESISKFVSISKTIGASIIAVCIIYVGDSMVIKIGVKIKKIVDNYLVEFI